MFAGPGLRDRLEPILNNNSFIKRIISFGNEFDQFVKPFKVDSTNEFECAAQPIDDNIAVILCSSGTTGLPKGVQLTQRNVMIGIEQHAYIYLNFSTLNKNNM